MKRCPRCNRAESDNTLKFCRVDGETLVNESSTVDREAATIQLDPSSALPADAEAVTVRLSSAAPALATTVLSQTQINQAETRALPKPNSRWLGVACVALLALCAGAAYLYFGRSSTMIGSIAVMPFVNETGNTEVEYLSDGITESLIGSLSQIPNLSVKARSSVFRYKSKQTNPQTIGRELNVQAVLNGRVVQRGDQLVLGLELIDAETENVIWSEQYNRSPADLVTLQSEIARDVSSKLQSRLSGSTETKVAKTYTTNPEAYQQYLKGRFHWNKRTALDLQKAVEYFQQAVALDPNYAVAFAGLSEGYTLLAAFGGAPPREVMPKAKDAALQAIALDNELAEPYVALGHTAEYYDYDFPRAEQHFRQALKLDPNYATAHEFLGTLLSNLGRDQEAEAEFKRALELGPLSLGANRMYGECLSFLASTNKALRN